MSNDSKIVAHVGPNESEVVAQLAAKNAAEGGTVEDLIPTAARALGISEEEFRSRLFTIPGDTPVVVVDSE